MDDDDNIGPDQDLSEDEIYDDEEESQDYRDILSKLSSDWILVEIEHHVSKRATEEFWRIANTHFHNLYKVKGEEGRKIPQFSTLRDKLYRDFVPPVKMDIGYECKATGKLTVVKDVEVAPVSRYPPSKFRKIFEIASVDVSNYS